MNQELFSSYSLCVTYSNLFLQDLILLFFEDRMKHLATLFIVYFSSATALKKRKYNKQRSYAKIE